MGLGDVYKRQVEEILEYQVDAIVTASVALSSELADRCQSAGIHVVQFNRVQERTSFSSVTTDNFSGGVEIARHLITQGYRHFGYIAGWEGASTQIEREAGFRAGLAAHNVDLFARGVGNFNTEEAAAAAYEMFRADIRPDAVFVANDHMAFAVLDVLRVKLGLNVPEDVSVVGYDDVQIAAWPSFDLTTIRQPSNEMVAETVTTLLAQIEEGKATPRHVKTKAPLVIRGSAKKQSQKRIRSE